MKIYKIVGLIIVLGLGLAAKTASVKYYDSKRIKIKEPSDIVLNPNGDAYYVVSDDGYLAKLNSDFTLNVKYPWKGYDCEAITVTESKILVMNESARQVTEFDLNGNYLRDFGITYMGARNSGFESLIYDKENKKFIAITEKNPIKIFEFDEKFNKISETYWENARDISSARLNNGFYYFLSDEDRTVFKVEPGTYKIIDKWKINVLNPEGLEFDKSGKMIIISDDLEKVFLFDELTPNL